MVAYPVGVLLDLRYGSGWRLLGLCLWQGTWALWALMQREQIRGGEFMNYLHTLPVSPGAWRRVDLVVLLIADTPLLVLLLAAALVVGARHGASWQSAQSGLLLIFLLCSQLCAQHAVLDEKTDVKMVYLLVDGWVALALALPPAGSAALLLGPSVLSVYGLCRGVPRLPFHVNGWAQPVVQSLQLAAATLLRRLPINLQLPLDILYLEHQGVMLGKLLSCSVITVASLALMNVWHFDQRCLPLALIASAFIALNASGLYRFLRQSHDAARPFTAPLPLPRRWWRHGDAPAVLSFGLPFVLVLCGALWARSAAPASVIGGCLTSFVAMLPLLRLPQLYSARHAVVLSTTFAALWTAAAVAALPT